MREEDILECCQAVLAFLCDDHEYAHFGLSVTMGEMDRVLSKNDFESSVTKYTTNMSYTLSNGTNMMVNFMRWLSHEYDFDSPDNYDDGRAYFSDGHSYPVAPAKLLLKAVIRDIKLKEIRI